MDNLCQNFSWGDKEQIISDNISDDHLQQMIAVKFLILCWSPALLRTRMIWPSVSIKSWKIPHAWSPGATVGAIWSYTVLAHPSLDNSGCCSYTANRCPIYRWQPPAWMIYSLKCSQAWNLVHECKVVPFLWCYRATEEHPPQWLNLLTLAQFNWHLPIEI